MAKQRADQMLVDRGLAESRTRAQALIMAGLVFAGTRKVDKPGQPIADDVTLDVRGRDHPWVSRGGIKLAHGLDHIGWNVADVIAIDVGSSTGGFTDVLLQRGAARVYAVDSGTNQLAWSLRQDPRVVVHEQTSARILTPAHVAEPIDLIVCDASFIGVAKVLERPLSFARSGARLMALIKPQFEAGRAEVGKGGVVRDPAVHARVCAEVGCWLAGEGWRVAGTTTSPITGPEGNVEFLIAAVGNDARGIGRADSALYDRAIPRLGSRRRFGGKGRVFVGGIASPGQLRMSFVRWAVVCVPLVLLLGFLSGRSVPVGGANPWYVALAKPALTPPGWAFPVGWTTLYVLIGLALAMVVNARGARRRGLGIGLFVVQFALNLAWTPVFFGLHQADTALLVIVAMLLVGIATTIVFGRIRTAAAWLMVPYLVWVAFAGALTWRIGQLNPHAETLVPTARTTQML